MRLTSDTLNRQICDITLLSTLISHHQSTAVGGLSMIFPLHAGLKKKISILFIVNHRICIIVEIIPIYSLCLQFMDGTVTDFGNQLTVALKPYRNGLTVLKYKIL